MELSTAKKEKLRDLELKRGGVAFVSEKSSVTSTPTIIIGLGGLGAKTLNALKGKFTRQIGKSDHVYFRAIDTDLSELNSLLKVRSDGILNQLGNLEKEEVISLYDPSMANILLPGVIPPNIKSWLNGELLGKRLDNIGAQQIRQIGRAMLTNDVNYSNVKAKLTTVIMDAINKRSIGGDINVIVIAGVSGGTGSGTVVDATYMIHDIFRASGYSEYRIAGYIYTPDAQFKMIQMNPIILQNLKKNGYAALKEIDYFMNIEESNSVYKLALGTGEVVSSKNIFNSCTLISGYAQDGEMNDLNVTIGRLTDYLLDIVTEINGLENGMMVPLHLGMGPGPTMLEFWFEEHASRRIYHRYATYKYQVLGYNSIVIPRDEILAYCVNKIYEAALKEFQNFTIVNKNMMQTVYYQTNIINPDIFTTYAININSNNPINRTINRTLILGAGYTKKMIKQNPMIAYEDACDFAQSERIKVNAEYQAVLEDKLFNALKTQVDHIFEQYGPYVALKTIEHKHDELSVGNLQEPFPGIVEMLVSLSNMFLTRAHAATFSYGSEGKARIILAAEEATRGIFTNHQIINSYVEVCCVQAVTDRIDTVLFKMISDVLINVAVKIDEYKFQVFDVYASILTEVGKLLYKDGQYFASPDTNRIYDTCSVDIIKNGGHIERLKKYLDSFISNVSVQKLTKNFIKRMCTNKEKWLALDSENDFDVVSEIRELMDNCLTNNNMKNDIIEKFVTVAYSPLEFTPDQLDAIWNDDSDNSPKTLALRSAANQIYQQLFNGVQAMANSNGVIPLSYFPSNYFISTLKETPRLTQILNEMINDTQGFTPAVSNSKDKFIIIQQYIWIPLYILQGMEEYNQSYVDHPSPGMHMDENNQNWGRFPNPYTIDSVARDIASKGRPAQDIEKYPDYKILMDVQKKAKDGIEKYGFVKIVDENTGMVKMYLQDITSKPEDMAGFKEKLYKAAIENPELNVIEFMAENGFVINPVEVSKGQTDVDFSITSFDQASNEERMTIYSDIPVPVPDVYKWLRKSIKYMDILNNDTEIFEELQCE